MSWARAVVRAACPESAAAVRLVLEVDGWSGHVAGQHVDLRLTAEDGYTAWRSYSIASAPEEALVSLVVQRVDAGEVSPYLISDVQEGDVLELRGPVGGHFIWHAALGGPVQLIAGGSGVVPFLSMLEHHRLSGSDAEVRLLYALRSPQDALGSGVLRQVGPQVQVTWAYSRSAPAGWRRPTGRLDAAVLVEDVWPPASGPQTFVCGPTGFVEAVAAALVGLGHVPTSIKTERYGDAA
jgi:ferredoxin-NADP reductase